MLTIIETDQTTTIEGGFERDTPWVPVADLEDALGWVLKPEGLCRAEVCIPISDQDDLVTEGRVELGAVASLLHRPMATAPSHDAVYLALSTEDYRSGPAQGHAPDFTLPDLSRELHSLSNQRGKKVLLAAWASW